MSPRWQIQFILIVEQRFSFNFLILEFAFQSFRIYSCLHQSRTSKPLVPKDQTKLLPKCAHSTVEELPKA